MMKVKDTRIRFTAYLASPVALQLAKSLFAFRIEVAHVLLMALFVALVVRCIRSRPSLSVLVGQRDSFLEERERLER